MSPMARVLCEVCIACSTSFMSSQFTEVECTHMQEKIQVYYDEVTYHGQVVNIHTKLNLRDNPSLDSNIIGELYNNEVFDIICRVNDWYKIKYEDKEGFIHSDYVEGYNDNPPYPVYVKPKEVVKEEKDHGVEIQAELTAYCNCSICSDNWGGQTAMQTRARVGVIAVPKNIPLGSKFYIPELTNYKSDGIFTAEDRGGAIVVKNDGTHVIDVWFPNHEAALDFGRKKTKIYLIK